MLFSRSCQYGIQATVLLAIQDSDKILMARDIAEKMNLPLPYLAKILQSLSKRGILHSIKGPKGGFKLGKHPEDILLRDIVDCIDGLNNFDNCIIGFAKCGEDNLCPVHETWGLIKESISESMLSKSVENLINEMKEKRPGIIADALFISPV